MNESLITTNYSEEKTRETSVSSFTEITASWGNKCVKFHIKTG